MKHSKTFGILVLIFAAMLGSCGTSEGLSGEQAEAVNRMATGASDATSTEIDVVTSGSQMGDNKAVLAKASMTRTNSQTGTLQQGWSFAGVANVTAAVKERVEADPVLQALRGQADRLLATQPVDEAAVSANAAAMAARIKEIEESVAKAGGDLSGLQSLTQVFTSICLNGTDEAVSEKHAAEIGKSLPTTVEAAVK